MNSTLVKILQSREDLSDYVYHFTKGSDARETLKLILDGQELRDVGNKGVICFTEAPLLSLTKMFKFFGEYHNPMYAPYGVAIKKDWLFSKGGRPVIYGLPEEKKLLLPEIGWRFEAFYPGLKDFTWLREWRIPVSILEIPRDHSFVITKQKDLALLFDTENPDIDIDVDWADGQPHAYAIGKARRRNKGISIEELEEASNMSKTELDHIIGNQNDSDSESFLMGSVAF